MGPSLSISSTTGVSPPWGRHRGVLDADQSHPGWGNVKLSAPPREPDRLCLLQTVCPQSSWGQQSPRSATSPQGVQFQVRLDFIPLLHGGKQQGGGSLRLLTPDRKPHPAGGMRNKGEDTGSVNARPRVLMSILVADEGAWRGVQRGKEAGGMA